MSTTRESKQDKFERLKKWVEDSYQFFERNYKRYSFFRRLVYETTLGESQRAFLASLGRPIAEFNLYNAYVSRLVGEFTKLEPTLNVCQEPSVKEPVEVPKIKLSQAHLHYVIHKFNQNGEGKECFKETTTGGFSALRVGTRYASPMSMHQEIYLSKCNPLLVGFDPMARMTHKGDGRYTFEVYPMLISDAQKQWPDCEWDLMKGVSQFGSFLWSVQGMDGNTTVMVCELFERVKKRIQIVQLSDGRIVPKKEYEKILESWDAFAAPPEVVGPPRWTDSEEVWRHMLCGCELLESKKTDWCYLPHVFVDGDSAWLNEDTGGRLYQFTRPIIYNVRGIQDLKNASGIALLNHLENMVQSKFLLKKEAIPKEQDYQDSITNIQKVNTVVVNAFKDNNPEQPIPDPIREVIQQPAPPEVMGAFNSAEQTFQTIQGGFSSNLGRQSDDLSGKALIEAASLDNAAATPFIDGYLKALEWCGVIMLDLMPKYILSERSIPVRMPAGEIKHVVINKGEKTFDYEPYSLGLTIEPGFSYQVQQEKTAAQLVAFSNAMPGFAEFMNSDEGMPILLQNLTIKNGVELQEKFKEFSAKKAQIQAQMANQPNPEMLIGQAEMLKAQADMVRAQADGQRKAAETEISAGKLALEQQRLENETIEVQATVSNDIIKDALAREKDKADIVGKNIENAEKMLNMGVM